MSLLDDSELCLTSSSTGAGSCKVREIEDSSMSGALTMHPMSIANHSSITQAPAAARSMRRGGLPNRNVRTTADQAVPSEVPGLDKALGKCKDPIVAACSARKITLRMFSDMQSKHQKALAVCKTALDFIQDDFTDEDTLQWSCICAVCGMCDVCGLCDIHFA